MNNPSPNRHDMDARPFKETSRAISDAANAPGEGMSPSVKAAQKSSLIAFAKSRMSPEKSKKPNLLPWFGGFAFAATAAVVVLAFYLTSQPGIRQPVGQLAASSLSIPAANAADAFAVFAEKSDASGMAVDSTITIESKVPVNASTLRQSLRIVPAVDFDLKQAGDNRFTLEPRSPLAAGEIYRVSIAAAIEDSAREFSWALQTAPDFKLVSSIPADGGRNVPVNTGVEFRFSGSGWEDPSSFVSVEPATPGRWETRGRTLTFVPNKPFSPHTRYEITVKKGFAPKGGVGLTEDARIRFETAAAETARPSDGAYVSIGDRLSAPINKSWTVSAYGRLVSQFDAVFYRITPDEARGLLSRDLGAGSWTAVDPSDRVYETLAKTEAFKAEVALAENTDYGQAINFPAIQTPGYYVLKLVGKNRADIVSWSFVQVTDNAYYMTADKDALYVWVVNASTNRVQSNIQVKVGDQTVRTSADGIAKLATPSVLRTDASKDGPVAILGEVGEGTGAAFAILERRGGFYFDRFRSANIRLWGYINSDRPLYRLSDEIKIFGLARDRETDRGVGEVTLELKRSSLWFDAFTGNEKVYAKTTVQTDSAGRFEGSLSWTDLSPGYFSVYAMQNGEQVAFVSFEVKEFIKPSYGIEVSFDRDRVYQGETVNATIRARFFDGTPVPRARIRLQLPKGIQGERESREVVTDENGVASYAVTMPSFACPPATVRESYCYTENTFFVEATPVEGEEGDIIGTASIRVRASRLGININVKPSGQDAVIDVRTWRHAYEAPSEGHEDNWSGRTLDGYIIGRRWERVSAGFYYDAIEKKQVERFRYEERLDPPVAFRVTTDARGQATHRFTRESGKAYQVVLDGKDDEGRSTRSFYWIWEGGSGSWNDSSPEQGDAVYLEISPEPKLDIYGGDIGYALGTELTATVRVGKEDFRPSEGSSVLFTVSARGIREVVSETSAAHKFRFERELMPNAEIRAVIWRNGKFEKVRASAQYDKTEKSLEIKAEAEQPSYAPGGKIRVRVSAKSKATGQPASNVVFAYSAVDKALLALSYDYLANPLYGIYGYVEDGIIFESSIFERFEGGGGGAEMGGDMGLAAKSDVRSNFKDTAAFGLVRTDSSGQAVVEFTAPDNLTSWRIEVIGISDSLDAGSARLDVPVTRPVFVSTVIPEYLLVKDKPVLKLRAFGTGLRAGSDLAYTVDAPTLGLSSQRVNGKAGESVYVAIDELIAGRHRMTIRVENGDQTDAIERFVDIAETRFTKNELVRTEAAPGSSIPELGQSEADIILTSKTKAALFGEYQRLAGLESARADALIAKRLALRRLEEDYGIRPENAPSDGELRARLSDYMDYAAYRLLPYGTQDLELTSEIVATAPEFVDRALIADYFVGIYDGGRFIQKPSALERLHALAGLAALGEPVLPDLQRMADEKEHGWREWLVIARGLESAGDRERARSLLERLLAQAETRDDLTWLPVSNDPVDVYEATADAAALASRLAHPSAGNLRLWVEENINKDAFPVLAQVRYLEALRSTSLGRDVLLSYTFGDDEKTLRFSREEPLHRLTLTSDEARRFRVTRVDGPVTIAFIRTVAGRPAPVPELALTRSYEVSRPLNDLREGDVVSITLKPEARGNLQKGCYLVQDHLPAGLKPAVSWSYSDRNWYPTEIRGSTVSFVTCNEPFETIRYSARVVSRGTFVAEAAMVSHLDYPSISAISQDAEIIVK
ncbi:Ig-like domain-containing protein [Candidatus Uhrbacteria bacterium]|nr:Ig-like domain-containing protein [Candidatus Uhrbacteria bacterium]